MRTNILKTAVMAAAVIFAAGAHGGNPPESAFTDRRDGKTYRTVKAGGNVWMAENLNYAEKGSACYGNKAENCAKYGRLYNWETAQKVCPAGWRLPGIDEWEALVKYAGGESAAGTKLKSKTGWKTSNDVPAGFKPNPKAEWKKGTDNYGFSALPGGFGNGRGGFANDGNGGNWWSAEDDDDYGAWGWHVSCSNEAVYGVIDVKSQEMSVRCVQDNGSK